MNLDKKLAKYARHLDNPKYYDRITKILMKADKIGYEFKSFNDYDMMKISRKLAIYYDVIRTEEEHKRMIHYYNKHWFIISDKNYILFESPFLITALSVYMRCYLFMLLATLRQYVYTDRLICVENVNNDIFLVRGAINTSKWLNCEINEIEDFFINTMP